MNGCLVLTGRVSLLVNVAGRKVDPAEVERMLVHLPEVIDAHVIGASCDHRGQQLRRILALIPELETERLLSTRSVVVRHVRCAGTYRHHSAEETSDFTHLVFPYGGVYVRQ